MRLIPALSRALIALILGVALLSGTPSAVALPAAETGTDPLTAPTLDFATVKGDNVQLIWSPAADSDEVDAYGVYADGEFLFRTVGTADSALVFLASEGLTGGELFTIRAEAGHESDGTPVRQSAPSNGLVPVPPAILPAPELIRGVYDTGNGMLTLEWTPSQSETQDTITYNVVVDVPFSGNIIHQVTNQTSTRFAPDSCGGACPMTGHETFFVVATDRTMADSPRSNGLVPTRI
jgi:hypothetical protein